MKENLEIFKPTSRCGFFHQRLTEKSSVDHLCKYVSAKNHSRLVPRHAKSLSEATPRRKPRECKSWPDNGVIDLVDTRKIKAKSWVAGRWVLRLFHGRPKGNRQPSSFKRWLPISNQKSSFLEGEASFVRSRLKWDRMKNLPGQRATV